MTIQFAKSLLYGTSAKPGWYRVPQNPQHLQQGSSGSVSALRHHSFLKCGLNKESSKYAKTNGPKPRARRSAPAESSSSGRVKSLSKGRAKACKAASPYPVMEASSSGGEVKVMVPSLGTDALDNSMVVNNGFNAYHLLPTHNQFSALPQGPFSNVINTPIKWQVEDELKAESRKKLSPTTTTAVTTNTAARTIPWAKRILMHKKGKMVAKEPTIAPQTTWYLLDCESDGSKF
ncbi:hypothetical protein BT96DRAFT_945517 [Gymnopus androsaceus JB14]|uniref:Uncharacterized protein n=1 Tax=Gymnopus androsaceus JB14 TaxID=1447944 RepID=A0A6A4H1P7_9AGAR|nr:hypothetical protein BT96DRAFT_945517 [Gymnopus androsaceus JB14]